MTQLYLPRNIIKCEFYFASDNISNSSITLALQENVELTEFQIANRPASHKRSHRSFKPATWHPASFREDYKKHIWPARPQDTRSYVECSGHSEQHKHNSQTPPQPTSPAGDGCRQRTLWTCLFNLPSWRCIIQVSSFIHPSVQNL